MQQQTYDLKSSCGRGLSGETLVYKVLHEEVMEEETNTRRLRQKKGDLCLLGRLNNGGMAQ